MPEEEKRGFFSKVRNAVDNLITPEQARQQKAPSKPKRELDPGVTRDGFNPTGKISQPKATGGLNNARATAQLNEQPAAPREGPPETELSPRRLAMIEDFMNGEIKIELMNDPMYMYKIVSDERAYQTRLLFEWRKRLQALPPNSPKAEDLQAKIKRAQAIVSNLFKVLKRITGTQGSTGGTDFLSDKK